MDGQLHQSFKEACHARCYSTDGPLSSSSTRDPPAYPPPCPPPCMQPLDEPSRRNSMISHQIMPIDSTFLFPLPCHDCLGQQPRSRSANLYLQCFPFITSFSDRAQGYRSANLYLMLPLSADNTVPHTSPYGMVIFQHFHSQQPGYLPSLPLYCPLTQEGTHWTSI